MVKLYEYLYLGTVLFCFKRMYKSIIFVLMLLYYCSKLHTARGTLLLSVVYKAENMVHCTLYHCPPRERLLDLFL